MKRQKVVGEFHIRRRYVLACAVLLNVRTFFSLRASKAFLILFKQLARILGCGQTPGTALPSRNFSMAAHKIRPSVNSFATLPSRQKGLSRTTPKERNQSTRMACFGKSSPESEPLSSSTADLVGSNKACCVCETGNVGGGSGGGIDRLPAPPPVLAVFAAEGATGDAAAESGAPLPTGSAFGCPMPSCVGTISAASVPPSDRDGEVGRAPQLARRRPSLVGLC